MHRLQKRGFIILGACLILLLSFGVMAWKRNQVQRWWPASAGDSADSNEYRALSRPREKWQREEPIFKDKRLAGLFLEDDFIVPTSKAEEYLGQHGRDPDRLMGAYFISKDFRYLEELEKVDKTLHPEAFSLLSVAINDPQKLRKVLTDFITSDPDNSFARLLAFQGLITDKKSGQVISDQNLTGALASAADPTRKFDSYEALIEKNAGEAWSFVTEDPVKTWARTQLTMQANSRQMLDQQSQIARSIKELLVGGEKDLAVAGLVVGIAAGIDGSDNVMSSHGRFSSVNLEAMILSTLPKDYEYLRKDSFVTERIKDLQRVVRGLEVDRQRLGAALVDSDPETIDQFVTDYNLNGSKNAIQSLFDSQKQK